MIRIAIVDRFSSELDDVALRAPQATFYHSSVWLESLSRAFPSMSLRYLVAEEEGEIVGYLPYFMVKTAFAKRIWSLPFGTYGGPIGVGENVPHMLLERFVAMRKDRGVDEIGVVDYDHAVNVSEMTPTTETNHVITLDPDFEKVWKRFDHSKRRQTRKAQRAGVEIRMAESIDDVKRYYHIYESRAESWQRRLRYPESLFVELFVRGRESVKIFLAYAAENLLGGHMLFYFKDTAIAWNGVTTEQSRGTQADTLLYATAIRDACDNGCRSYNLGASLGKTSLNAYKEALGGELHTYRTLRWRSWRGRVAAAALKRLLGR
jgi:hypothetical protein